MDGIDGDDSVPQIDIISNDKSSFTAYNTHTQTREPLQVASIPAADLQFQGSSAAYESQPILFLKCGCLPTRDLHNQNPLSSKHFLIISNSSPFPRADSNFSSDAGASGNMMAPQNSSSIHSGGAQRPASPGAGDTDSLMANQQDSSGVHTSHLSCFPSSLSLSFLAFCGSLRPLFVLCSHRAIVYSHHLTLSFPFFFV